MRTDERSERNQTGCAPSLCMCAEMRDSMSLGAGRDDVQVAPALGPGAGSA